jgi:hypothetical protein
VSPINTSLKSLITASFINLVGNLLGTAIALQQNLAADWGGCLDGRNVLRNFLGFKGTDLSVPLSFMLIQFVIRLMALQPGLWTYPFVTEGIVGATVTLHPGENKFVVNFGWDYQFK